MVTTPIPAPDGAYNNAVDMTFDADGNIILAWIVSGGGTRKAYVEKVAPDGTVIEPLTLVYSQGGNGFNVANYDVSLSFGGDATGYIAYLQAPETTAIANLITVRTLTGALGLPDTGFTVAAQGTNGFLHADIAVRPSGGVAIADIEEIRGGAQNTIQSTRISLRNYGADGVQSGPEIILATESGSAFNESTRDVSVAVAGNGNEVVAYLRAPSSTAVPDSIVVETFDADLSRLHDPIVISAPAGGSFSSVDITADDQNSCIVTYRLDIRSDGKLMSRSVVCQRIDADGTLKGDPLTVYSESGQYYILGYRGLSVATSPDGENFVAVLSAASTTSPSQTTSLYNISVSLFSSSDDNIDFNQLSPSQIETVDAGADLYHGRGGNDLVVLPDTEHYTLTPSVTWNPETTFYTGSQEGDTATIDAGSGAAIITGGAGKDILVLDQGTLGGVYQLTTFGGATPSFDQTVYTITYNVAGLTQVVTVSGVEVVRLKKGIDNVVIGNDAAQNVALEMLRLADEVYGPQVPLKHDDVEALAYQAGHHAAFSENVSSLAQHRGWHAVAALELGMKPADYGEASVLYSFVGGVYQATDKGTGVFVSEANAMVLTGLVNGVQTLAIAFRGTDQTTDFGDYINFKSHFDKFAPLVTALQTYLQDNTDIRQVLISGHSLGAAMAEYMTLALAPWDAADGHVVATYTAGSPGSEAAPSGSAIVNFINEGDPVPKLGEATTSIALRVAFLAVLAVLPYQVLTLPVVASMRSKPREGSNVYLGSDVDGGFTGLGQHASHLYYDNVKKLTAFALDPASPFYVEELAAALRNGGVYNGHDLHISLGRPLNFDAEQARTNYDARYTSTFSSNISARAYDDYVLGNNGDGENGGADRLNVGISAIKSKSGLRIFDGGAGEDTISLAEFSSTNYRLNFDSESHLVRSINFLGANRGNAVFSSGFVGFLSRIEIIAFRDKAVHSDGTPVSTQRAAGLSGADGAVFTVLDSFGSADAGDGDMRVVGSHLANIIYIGSGNKSVEAGAGEDIIIVKTNGPADRISIDGGYGADVIYGGTGLETYSVDNADDQVFVGDPTGSHTIMAAVSYALPDNVQSLVLTGDAIVGEGNELDNVLTGNARANALNGEEGADTMSGGAGDDSYFADTAGDWIVEAAVGGLDVVYSVVAYTLATGQFIENLILTGAGDVGATGNNLVNSLTGNAGNNLLDGKAAGDIMAGGAGNDTYVVDNAGDITMEAVGEGADVVASSVRYTLGDNIERLTLTGTAGIAGTGNGLNNVITGNSGNNRIDGGLGADTMSGGAGDDNYAIDDAGDRVFENANEGNDSIAAGFSYNLGTQYIENLTLTGADNLTAIGNALANTLIGNTGNNVLNGGNAADNMWGGAGDDSYYVDNVGDRTFEKTTAGGDAGGRDVVYASVRVVLDQYVEDLVITGTAGLAGTGNGLDNTLTGNSGNNILAGKDGNDRLDGAAGSDIMAGGLGDDTFYVDNALDRVAELKDQGTDAVMSSVSFSLGNQYIETLALTGGNAINATGSALANNLMGNAAANILDGGRGNDILTGGLGADIFLFGLLSGADTITDFSAGDGDSLNLNAYSHGVVNGGGIAIAQIGADAVITLGGGNVVTVTGALLSDVATHITW